MRPTRIEIDMKQARQNFTYIREHMYAGTETTAVIKANAYGHGVVPFARLAVETGYESLAVAIPEEAIAIRSAGITLPIYLLGLCRPESYQLLVDMDCIPAICDSTDLRSLDLVGRMYGKVIRCMVAVDTGMHRIGILPEEALSFLESMKVHSHLEVVGFFSHMACADAPDKTHALRQVEAFEAMKRRIEEAYPKKEYFYSMNNSAGSVCLPQSQYSSVRPGIILYGVSPFADPLEDVRIRPVLTLKSVVVHVRTLEAGETVGYGAKYTTTRRTQIATVPIGYEDGYSRRLSNAGVMLIRGHRCRVAGTVCMDQVMVEIPEGLTVYPGDEVVLIGKQGDEQIYIEELAKLADTIPYEIFTCLSERIRRVCYDAGKDESEI